MRSLALCHWPTSRCLGLSVSTRLRYTTTRLMQTYSGSSIEVYNPYSGELHCEVAKTTLQEARQAVLNADAARKEWWADCVGHIGLVERQYRCSRFLENFDRYADQIALDLSCMMGKPLQQSYNEIETMKERAQGLIDTSTQFLSDLPVPPIRGYDRKIRKEPIGTVLVVVPWNYPLLCAINSLIPALLSGNAVLLKMSSKTPLIAEHLIRALLDIELPEGMVTALHCDHDTTLQLIREPGISTVVFTGSASGGYQVQNATSSRLINATLELGGKDPAYVTNDADVDHAVKSVVDGAMYNAGQSCCAVERVYVHADVYDDFIEAAEELINETYVLGDPLYEHPRDVDKRKARDSDGFESDTSSKQPYKPGMKRTTTMGPMAQKSNIEFLSKQVDEAVSKGAKLVVGDGQCLDGKFFKPTLLKECTHDMSIMKEESFGPILPVMKVESDAQAIELMNDSSYGLSAAVYTADKMKMERLFARHLECGTVFMNRCDYLDPALPWSGRKETGKGLSLSHYSFDNFTTNKSFNFKLKT